MIRPRQERDDWSPRPLDYPPDSALGFMPTREMLETNPVFRLAVWQRRRSRGGKRLLYWLSLILVVVLCLQGISIKLGTYVGWVIVIGLFILLYEYLWVRGIRRTLTSREVAGFASIPRQTLLDLIDAGVTGREFAEGIWAAASSRGSRRSALLFLYVALAAAVWGVVNGVRAGGWNHFAACVGLLSMELLIRVTAAHSAMTLLWKESGAAEIFSRKHFINLDRYSQGSPFPLWIFGFYFPLGLTIQNFPDICAVSAFILMIAGFITGTVDTRLLRGTHVVVLERMASQLDAILYTVWRMENDRYIGEPIEVRAPERRALVGIAHNPGAAGLKTAGLKSAGLKTGETAKQ
jgi:hypothetical protein